MNLNTAQLTIGILILALQAQGQFLFVTDHRSVAVSGIGYSSSQAPTSAFSDFTGSVTGSGGVNPSVFSSAFQFSTCTSNAIYVTNTIYVGYSQSSPGPSQSVSAQSNYEVTFQLENPTLVSLSGEQWGDGEVFAVSPFSLRSQAFGTITSSSPYPSAPWTFFGLLQPGTYTLDMDSLLNWSSLYDMYIIHYGRIHAHCLLIAIPRPQITMHPQNVTVSPGSTANFSTLVTGDARAGQLTYQWQFNGANLPGQTNNVLTITNATPAVVGTYSLIASNYAGVTCSSPAFLSLLSAERYTGLTIAGTAGQNYRIDYCTQVNNNWLVLTNITLPTSSYLFIDVDSPRTPQKFYRAVLQ